MTTSRLLLSHLSHARLEPGSTPARRVGHVGPFPASLAAARLVLLALGLGACGDDVVERLPKVDTFATDTDGDEPPGRGSRETSGGTFGLGSTGLEADPTGELDSTGGSSSVGECGDGILDVDERCDDGNRSDGDACREDCTLPLVARWTRREHGGGRDVARDVLLDDEGNVYVLGSTAVQGEGADLWLRSYSPQGRERWTFTHRGPAHGADEGNALAWHPSGDLLIAGYQTTADGADALVMRLPIGADEPLWLDVHDGGVGGDDFAFGITSDLDGRIVVAGSQRQEDDDGWIRAYEADGGIRWSAAYDDPRHGGTDFAMAVVTDDEGNALVAGTTVTGVHEIEGWLRRFDPTGAELATERHDAAVEAMTVGSTGDVVLAGWRYAYAGDSNLWVARWSLAQGLHAEVVTDGGAHLLDLGLDVAVDEVGGVYVAGVTTNLGQQHDAWLHGYDEDLQAHRWSLTHDGEAHLNDEAFAIAASPDGRRVVVVGFETVLGQDLDAWIRMYDQAP